MKKYKKHIIIYTFQSLEDPLLKGLMLEYLIRINKQRNELFFHLITHEQKQYKFSTLRKKDKRKELAGQHIKWYPVNYKSGKLLLLKKIYNFIQTFIICLFIKFRYTPKVIVGFLPIAGGYSTIIAKVLRLKLVVFCFEPHSEYMIDFNVWKKNSLKYKLLKKFEKMQIKKASHLTLPTQASVNYANKINPDNKKYLLPISVDTDLFKFSEEKREALRKKLNTGNKIVIIYTGKFGGIYFNTKQIASLFKNLLEHYNDYYLLVITPDAKEMKSDITKLNIPQQNYSILDVVPYEQLPAFISAADIGLIAIPSYASQKFRTPVKTALYLSCGIPYIVNKGIAEDDMIAQKENIGIVIDDFDNINHQKLSDEIINICRGDIIALRNKCRKIAVEQRSINLSVNILNDIINDIIA